MKRYLYLSLTPEALIASMLPPEEFGNYLAVGTKKRTRGQAIFFEIEPDFESGFFNLKDIEKRCVPHSDGTPKRTSYLSIYRVLEHVPLSSFKNLYLTTDDGRTLGLEKKDYKEEKDEGLHLYQELSPITPRIATKYNPREFIKFVTDNTQPISIPRLVFVELTLNGLASDPVKAPVNNLPYPNIDHLRDCLIGLKEHPEKHTKTVIRYFQGDLLYRTCKNGFYVGDKKDFLFYPLPDMKDLEGKYYPWWRSALVIGSR